MEEHLEDRALNVFFVVDKEYIIHFTVALTSLLENNKDLLIKVYVIHDISNHILLDRIYSFFKEKYSVLLNLTAVEQKLDNLYTSDHITKASYYRLLLADIIPEEVLQGLYLDCDLIVTGSLKELINTTFLDRDTGNEFSLLAVRDIRATGEITRLNDMGINSQSYFNSGILYINLKKWRSNQVSCKLLDVAEQYNEKLKWHDQDVLNIYFYNDTGELGAQYNKFASQKHSSTPLIIHYLGDSKPWHYIDNGPYKKMYWHYLKMTPFSSTKFEDITLEKVLRKYVRLFRQTNLLSQD